MVQKQKQDIELTKQAYKYSNEKYSHDEIVKILNGDNDVQKQICIINLNDIKSQNEADILISHLTNRPTPIREVTSHKILEFIRQKEYSKYFQNKPALDIFLDAIIDINPSVSRNMIEILNCIENKEYCYKMLLERITNLIDEIKNIPKNKSYSANKKNFSLYWYLEALYVFTLSNVQDEMFINILEFCSLSDEYTIREKCTKIISLLKNSPDKQIQNILVRLQEDENFYVQQKLK